MEGFASLSYCQDCGRYVCVDLAEHPTAYGNGVTEPCTETQRRLGMRGRRW